MIQSTAIMLSCNNCNQHLSSNTKDGFGCEWNVNGHKDIMDTQNNPKSSHSPPVYHHYVSMLSFRTILSSYSAIITVILCFTLHVTAASSLDFTVSGCADGSTEGFQDQHHPSIAACSGSWEGHIENATAPLCAPGWQVCGWRDENILKTITWQDATNLTGCYAINAAQDGGTCKACSKGLEQDDMAGVGQSCPHQSYGQRSCISGGKIDASCCMDTHFDKACMYQPGSTSGALCCKKPEGVAPQILIHPQSLTHVLTGVTFVLSCQAMGHPVPEVKWFKDGHSLDKNNTRVSEFSSGYLLISLAKEEDSGDYQCVVTNIVGKDFADAKVLVTDHSSGCSDGSTEGLSQYENIQACAGSWEGHVKRGKSLCKKGWHVCNPKHEAYLKLLTWSDVTELDGCYAYNAMSTYNKCRRCHRENLAGIGKKCGKTRKGATSCLAQGQVQVFEKDKGRGCGYDPDISGVMCCKRPKRNTLTQQRKDPDKKCTPRCINGGTCVGENKCECPKGYKGAWCQHPVCYGGCVPNSYCIKPDVCRCYSGYTFNGEKCTQKEKQSRRCKNPCFNGGMCKHGYCKCAHPFYGKMCQHGGSRHVLIIEKTLDDGKEQTTASLNGRNISYT